jgi:hypothetical protein
VVKRNMRFGRRNRMRYGRVLALAAAMAFGAGALAQSSAQQGGAQPAKHSVTKHTKKSAGSGHEAAKGGEDIGKGVGHGSESMAKGAAGSAGDLATGHPVMAGQSAGKGAVGLGKDSGKGAVKGTAKVGKGVGGGLKKLGHKIL